MATIGATHLTLADHVKRFDPDGKSLAQVAEILAQTNAVLTDLPYMEGNLPTGHRSTIRTGLPQGTWRKLYQGVAATKATVVQVDDAIGMLEDRSEVDVDLATLNGAVNEFRLAEARPHIEGLGQQLATTFFYGDTDTNPERFTGLGPRYNSLSAGNAQNIIDGAGTGSDNTSIWLVCMDPKSVFGIYPKGSRAGIIHEDLGIADAFDASNNRYRAYMDRFQVKAGIVLKDWRYTVRICNIDVSNMIGESTAADLVKLMIKAMARIPEQAYDSCRWYANRTVLEWLDIQSMGKATSASGVVTNVQFTDQDKAQGRIFRSFRGIPFRVCDALLLTEARIT